MHLLSDNRHSPSTPRLRASGLPLTLLLVLLAACTTNQPEPTATPNEVAEAPTETPIPTDIPPSPTSEPTSTPILTPDYEDLSTLQSFAVTDPDATFELYLRDTITQQVLLQRAKLDMRVRYQDPDLMLRDLGGLIINIELLEDRSRQTILRENSATFQAEIDIRITFANLDTDSQTCKWTVGLARSGDFWYIVNPSELLVFLNCQP